MATLTAVFLLLSSCKDDKDDAPEPQPGPEIPAAGPSIDAAAWTFGGEAGNYVLAVATDKAWNASSDAAWIKLDKTTGEGEVGLGLTVEENTTGAKRTGTITIKAVADSKVVMTFKVIQEAIEYTVKVTSEDTIRNISASGQVIVIDVEANTDYTFELSEWTTVAAAPSAAGTNTPFALTKSKITLNVDKNLTEEERMAYVVIRKGEEKVKEVILIQKGAEPLTDPSMLVINVDSPDDDTLYVDPMGGVIKMNVTASNVAYECTLTDWGTSSLMSGSNTVTELQNIIVNPNLTFGRRERILLVESKTEGVEVSKMVTIIQQPVEITITELERVPVTGGVGFLKVNCPKEIDFEVGEVVSSAVPADKTSEDNQDPTVLKFTVSEKNFGSSPKEYKVVLKFSYDGFENGKVYPQCFFSLYQKPISPMTVTWDGQGETGDMTVAKENAPDVDFTVTSEVSCTPVITYRRDNGNWEQDANGWITVVEKAVDASPYIYTLQFADSKPGTKKREAQVAFKMNGGFDGVKTIGIEQEEYPLPAEIKFATTVINVGWEIIEPDFMPEYYVTVVPADAKLEAAVSPDEFGYSLTESNTPGNYVLKAFGKTANETDAVKTGELILTLKDKDGNETLATKTIVLQQEFKVETSGVIIDLEGTEHHITGRPLNFYANGSTTGYKVVNANNPSQNMGWLTVNISEKEGGSAQITIMPWTQGPPSQKVAVVPADFSGDDCSAYPQFTIFNS